MEMTNAVKEQFESLNSNIGKILELEDDIKKGVAAAKGVADLQKQVADRSLDNAEYIEKLQTMFADQQAKQLNELSEMLTERMDEMETKYVPGKGGGKVNFAKSIAAKFDESGMTADGQGPSKFKAFSEGTSIRDITDAGTSNPDLARPEFDDRFVPIAKQAPRVADLVTRIRVTSAVVEYVRQETGVTAETQEGQGALKNEGDITTSLQSAKVETIAVWVHAAAQILDDVTRLQDFVNGRLRMAILRSLDAEILTGDGTTNHFTGLLSEAEAYDATLITQLGVQAPTSIDDLRAGILQVRSNQYTPTGLVLSPFAWAGIELRKDANNQYIFTSPQNQTAPRLWGFPVVDTTEIPQEQFLVGDFMEGATLYDRQMPSVQASTEDQDNFVRNMVTILAELRAAFAVNAPSAFVTGTLTVGS